MTQLNEILHCLTSLICYLEENNSVNHLMAYEPIPFVDGNGNYIVWS